MWRTEEYSGSSTGLGERCQVSAGQARVTGPGRGRGGADNGRDAVHLQEAVQEFGGLQSGEDIAGIAARGDTDEKIARLGETFDLAGKSGFETVVVYDAGDE